eukprot:g3604.t1
MRLAAGAVLAGSRFVAADEGNGLGCTASVWDAASTVDNIAFAGMNADCSDCDPRLAYVAPGDYETGDQRPVHMFYGSAPRWVGYGRGNFYEPKDGEKVRAPIGHIPQVAHTYGYWEAVLPLINEKGLSMGESSCAARLMNWPVDQKTPGPSLGVPALLDLTSLMQIAMERCASARCAVETMGAMSEKYGFFPMPNEWTPGKEADGRVTVDDGGEAITIADAKGEAWVFHVVGGVPSIPEAKSVWAAQRLPEGHAAFIANNFILRELPDEPTEEFLFSKYLHQVAVAAKIYDPTLGKQLHFAKTFAPDTVTFQTHGQPIPLYASLRLWRLLNLAAPSQKFELVLDPLEYPMSVKVENAVSRREIFKMHGDLYKDTEFDLGKGALAGPFGNPFPVEGGVASSLMGQIPRGISIARTVYCVMSEARGDGKAVAWFGTDTPATSVFVPVLAASSKVDSSYQTGTNREFTRQSAWWAFDFTSNWMKLNFNMMAEKDVYPKQDELQSMLDGEYQKLWQRTTDLQQVDLNEWQQHIQKRVVESWWQLADYLVVKYNDGFLNDPSGKMGGVYGYPRAWAEQVDFNGDIHPIEVERKLVAEKTKLPATFAEGSWLYETPTAEKNDCKEVELVEIKPPGAIRRENTVEAFASQSGSFALTACVLFVAGISFGFLLGRRIPDSVSDSDGSLYRTLI